MASKVNDALLQRALAQKPTPLPPRDEDRYMLPMGRDNDLRNDWAYNQSQWAMLPEWMSRLVDAPIQGVTGIRPINELGRADLEYQFQKGLKNGTP